MMFYKADSYICIFILLFLISCSVVSHAVPLTDYRFFRDEIKDRPLRKYEEGYRLYRSGRLNEAERSLKEALRLEPNLLKAHYWLGKVYTELGRLDDAIAHWKQVEVIEELIERRRRALVAVNNEYPAIEQTQSIDVRRQRAREAFEKGQYFLRAGHWNAAEAKFDKAVHFYSGNIQYLLASARLLIDNNKILKGIKRYNQLLMQPEVSYEHFVEGIELMIKHDTMYLVEPLIVKHRNRFDNKPGFIEVLDMFKDDTEPERTGAGVVVERRDGQVVINIGVSNGFSVSDEYSLNLRAFKAGEKIYDPVTRKVIGFTEDTRTADLLVTKVSRNSSWALVRREFGRGVKAGDLIEIKKAAD